MNLQQLIKKKGLTNYRLAKDAKVGQATVCELASGKRKEPRYSTAVKLSKILDVDILTIYEAIRGQAECNLKQK